MPGFPFIPAIAELHQFAHIRQMAGHGGGSGHRVLRQRHIRGTDEGGVAALRRSHHQRSLLLLLLLNDVRLKHVVTSRVTQGSGGCFWGQMLQIRLLKQQ